MNTNSSLKVYILISLLSIFSCSNAPPAEFTQAQIDWVGKELILDFSRLELMHKRANNKPLAKPVSFIHYFNANCSLCITELKSLNEFLNCSINFSKTNVVFIANGKNTLYVKYLIESKELDFNYDLYYDSSNHYFLENNLSDNKSLHSILIDQSDQILFIGNPIKSDYVAKTLIEDFF